MSQIVLLTPEQQAAKRAAQLKRLAALPSLAPRQRPCALGVRVARAVPVDPRCAGTLRLDSP